MNKGRRNVHMSAMPVGRLRRARDGADSEAMGTDEYLMTVLCSIHFSFRSLFHWRDFEDVNIPPSPVHLLA